MLGFEMPDHFFKSHSDSIRFLGGETMNPESSQLKFHHRKEAEIKMRVDHFCKALGVLTLAAAVLLEVTKANAQETIKIGMTSALTGPYNEYGEGARRGLELAIEKWNAKGGINGKK